MKWRNKLLLLLAAMMLWMLLSTVALAETLSFGTVRNGNSVNLRYGASKNTQKVGSYTRGTWLRINGQYGEWCHVTGPDGKSGYMMKEYIQISATAKGVIGIVDAASGLNLRASANASGKSIGVYSSGVPCILLQQTGDWYYVSVDGKKGFFHADYLTRKYTTYSPDVATVVNPKGGAVNLRKGPGTSYGIIKSIKNGSYAMILQQGNGWWKISVNGYVGFMDSSYLKDGIVGQTTGTSGSTGSGSSAEGYATVNTGNLYLRSAASKASKNLGLFPRGTYVTVLDQGNTWCKVRVNGTTGYMMTEYLKFHGLNGVAIAYVKHPNGTFVNMRNAPSKTTGTVLMQVPHNARVTVLVPGTTWSQIQYNGKTGYMMNQFLNGLK